MIHETQNPWIAGLMIGVLLAVFYFTVDLIVRTGKEGFKMLWGRIRTGFDAWWKRHICDVYPYDDRM